jgi:hypothetical protein
MSILDYPNYSLLNSLDRSGTKNRHCNAGGLLPRMSILDYPNYSLLNSLDRSAKIEMPFGLWVRKIAVYRPRPVGFDDNVRELARLEI